MVIFYYDKMPDTNILNAVCGLGPTFRLHLHHIWRFLLYLFQNGLLICFLEIFPLYCFKVIIWSAHIIIVLKS